eukprot:SAG31_NODE_5865_length_2283_cov_4.999580_3_plen_266_part_00
MSTYAQDVATPQIVSSKIASLRRTTGLIYEVNECIRSSILPAGYTRRQACQTPDGSAQGISVISCGTARSPAAERGHADGASAHRGPRAEPIPSSSSSSNHCRCSSAGSRTDGAHPSASGSRRQRTSWAPVSHESSTFETTGRAEAILDACESECQTLQPMLHRQKQNEPHVLALRRGSSSSPSNGYAMLLAPSKCRPVCPAGASSWSSSELVLHRSRLQLHRWTECLKRNFWPTLVTRCAWRRRRRRRRRRREGRLQLLEHQQR